MHAEPELEGILARPQQRNGKVAVLIVVSLLASVLAIYWRTTLSMVSIWQRSETFAHGFIVIPIFVYLAWRNRETLAVIEPKPCLAALWGIAAAGAVWMIGERVSAAVVAQFAMIAMIPFAVWAVLGTRMAKALDIPLAFLFFAVPFGEFLVPALMDRTADFTVAAIRASGVPVYRDGNFFTIPSGSWSVVEACSGLRYLIASFMVGSLYAYLSYRSLARRAAFIVASIVVPIIANWLRAYMIVMLGHLTSNRLAVGADHLIYGWIFFGVVMALLFWIGSRWREDEDPVPASEPAIAGRSGATRSDRRVPVAAVAALALAAIWLPIEARLVPDRDAATVELGKIAGRDGWAAVPRELSAWRPDIAGASAELRQTFERGGLRVGLHVALFRDQTRNAKAITTQNQLVRTTNARWKQADSDTIATEIGGQPFGPRTGVVTDGRERLAAWQWFWVDGRITSSEYVAKFYQALSILQGHGDPVAWVIVYAPTERGEVQSRAALQAFTAAMQGSIEAALRQAARAGASG